ncbi:hypothetical protein GWI33_014817 [Rhynchophorus ferrugineus]|uniref:Odorant binding protein n=1 Tax=Rhynchophorus ferrugineus TaxID=354439 RepID=A0A834I0U4_RHYFE|nr:hypothetical protein GWI33_014817 [Rhynchophorus ferrugineus]
MKALLAIVALISIAVCVTADLTDEQKQKIIAYGKECVTQTGVDKELVHKARQGSFTDDSKLKSFTFCISKKIGFQNDNGDAQADVIKQKLAAAINDADAADKLIAKCLEKKDTPEETAYETFKCYYENTPVHLSIF